MQSLHKNVSIFLFCFPVKYLKNEFYFINLTKFELSLYLKQEHVYCKTGLKYWLRNMICITCQKQAQWLNKYIT